MMSFLSYLEENKEIIRGDDYDSTINRALTWDLTGLSVPNLTAATVTFTYETFSKAVTVTNPAADQTLTLELTDTETAALDCRKSAYNIKAVLSGGQKITIVIGKLIIRDDV